MADVNGLLQDPEFNALSPADQRSTLSRLDPDFANLSDTDYQSFRSRMSSPQTMANVALSRQGLSVGPPPRPKFSVTPVSGFGANYSRMDSAKQDAYTEEDKQPFRDIGQGVSDIVNAPTGERRAYGAHEVLSGGFGLASKVLPAVAPISPVRTAIGVGSALAGKFLGTGGLNLAGAGEGYSELGGDVLGGLTGGLADKLGGSKLAKSTWAAKLLGDPHLLMMKAARPANNVTNALENLQTSMPQVKAVEGQLGPVERSPFDGQITQTPKPIETLDDALAATKIAKQRTWAKFKAMFPQSAAVTLDHSNVADRMEGTVSDMTAFQDPAKAAAVKNDAAYFRSKPNGFTVEETEAALQEINARLESYYAKNPGARNSLAAKNPDIASLVAAGDQLRSNLYNHLDTYGKDGSAAAKREYGTLLELEDALYRRRNVWLRQAPQGIADMASNLMSAGLSTRGILNFFGGNVPGAISDLATAATEKGMGRWIKNLNSTDGLIKRAFANYPDTSQPWVQPRAALTQGDIITSRPADTSFVRTRPTTPQERVNMERRMLPPGPQPPVGGPWVQGAGVGSGPPGSQVNVPPAKPMDLRIPPPVNRQMATGPQYGRPPGRIVRSPRIPQQ